MRFQFLVCLVFVITSVGLGHGFLLTGVKLRTDLPKLPQYAQYGRSMVLVGGNLKNNTEVYEAIIQMAGGKGVAKIGIINAASADPMDGFNFYRTLMLHFGALEANRIPIDLNHTHNNANQSVIDLIYGQTGFFFGGGDQARVLHSFLYQYGDFTPGLIALHQMFDAGAVISGTSAGTTCQTSNIMLKSGTSYDALRYGSYPDVGVSNGNHDEMIYASTGGLGFMRGYVLDTHFSERGRQGRMIRVLADTHHLTKGTNYGIGIDETTALVLTQVDDTHMAGKVLGASGVSFFDLSKATVTKETYFHISNVYLTYLTHNDIYHFNNRSVTFASTKTPMRGHEKYSDVLTTDDVFDGRHSITRKPEFVRISTSVVDSQSAKNTYGKTFEGNPKFRVNLSGSGHDTEGWVERKQSFHSDITSFENMHVEIVQS